MILNMKSEDKAVLFVEWSAARLDATHLRPGGAEGSAGGGGLRWPCMAALSLCLFDIWPKQGPG